MIVAVAAPELAAAIQAPADLACANLIENDCHTMRGVFPEWETLLATLGIVDLPLRIRRYSDTELSIQAAIAGLGITLAWHNLVRNDLKAGRLVRILNHEIPTDLGYYLVMPNNRAMLSKAATFRAWLFEQSTEQPSGND